MRSTPISNPLPKTFQTKKTYSNKLGGGPNHREHHLGESALRLLVRKDRPWHTVKDHNTPSRNSSDHNHSNILTNQSRNGTQPHRLQSPPLLMAQNSSIHRKHRSQRNTRRIHNQHHWELDRKSQAERPQHNCSGRHEPTMERQQLLPYFH